MKLTRARQAGFTLLEMLVVMLIVSLISTILFQALDQVYKLQSRRLAWNMMVTRE